VQTNGKSYSPPFELRRFRLLSPGLLYVHIVEPSELLLYALMSHVTSDGKAVIPARNTWHDLLMRSMLIFILRWKCHSCIEGISSSVSRSEATQHTWVCTGTPQSEGSSCTHGVSERPRQSQCAEIRGSVRCTC
jgi:hypothetical protein